MSIKIEYKSSNHRYNWGGSCLGVAADQLLKSRIFDVLTLGHLHTLIHELGHALAYKLVTGKGSTIHLNETCYGATEYKGEPESDWQKTYVNMSGPLASIIFSLVMMLGFSALTHYVPMNSYAALALNIWAITSNAIWIFGELFYGVSSVVNEDKGDFGLIARTGWKHLLVSSGVILLILGIGLTGVSWFLHPFELHF